MKIQSVLVAISLALTGSAFAQQADYTLLPTAQPKPKPAPKPAPPAVKPVPPVSVQLYNLLGVNAIFVQAGGRTAYADGLRATLLAADKHGLVPQAYWTNELETAFMSIPLAPSVPGIVDPAPAAPGTPAPAPTLDPKLEAFEAKMVAALLKYAGHLSTGRVNPQGVGDDVKVSKNTLSIEAVAAALKNTSISMRESMEALAPRWPLYRRLQDALARLSTAAANGNFPPLKSPNKNFKNGDTDDNVKFLKMRLQTLGYAVPDLDATYNDNLKPVVLQYLVDHGLQGNGEIGKGSAIWAHIGVPAEQRLQQIRITMEKMRWLPAAPDQKYVFVNLAFQKLSVFENQEETLSMKTINGRPKRSTPTLRDKLSIVEMNPSWTVPPRIVVFDKIKAIQEDPDYLRKNNFILLDRDMRPIDGWGGGWNDVDLSQTDSYYLRQLPGTGNALGILKFHLTNPYAIYLHDTNERNLFTNRDRLLSSGCIRLERPVDFANYMLRGDAKYTPAFLQQNLATTRRAEKNIPQMLQIKLPASVPVYTFYLTANVNEGRLLFATDSYTQDTRLFELLTYGEVRTKSPADMENEELRRREAELREGGGGNIRRDDEEDWRDRRDRERERDRRDRDRRGNECWGFWC